MKKNLLGTGGRIWASGIFLFILRMGQNRTGFDAETGLSLPSLPGKLLVGVLIFLFVAEFVLSRRQSKEKRPFADAFSPPGKLLTALIIGIMLLIAGGLLSVMDTMSAQLTGAGRIAWIAASAMAVFSGAGLLVLVKKWNAGDELSVAPLLPTIFFGVFFVLAVYLPRVSDPVYARFYLQVLAAAMVAYAFSQLTGFLRGESSRRSFIWIAELAVMTSIAAMADGGQGQTLLFGGCALVLSVFLLLAKGD